jgi:hypothetical protein
VFLYSIEGSIPAAAATESDKRDLAQRVCAELKRFDWEATIQGTVVSFLNNRNVLRQMMRADQTSQFVDSGEFVIDGFTIRYRLVTSSFIFWTAVLALPLTFCLVIQSLVGLAGVVGYWLLTCVASSVWISFRIRRALQRATVGPLS